MSIISDSSQEASNAAIGSNLTPVSSPNLFIKSDLTEVQQTSLFRGTPDLVKPNTSLADQSQKRRSSSRSIKRKKFDDELVESSLVKTSRPRPHNVAFPLLSSAISLSSPSIAASPSSISANNQSQADVTTVLPIEKRRSRPNQKRVKKQKSNQSHLTKDVSRWKPTDDLTLILSIQQTNSIEDVYRGVKFSSQFSYREVQERWYSLLYDPTISKPALIAIKQLSSEVMAQIKAKLMFSEEEEKLIASVPFDKGNLEIFQELLDSNASVFLPSRTPKALYMHWTLMKQYNLLQDQNAQQPVIDSLLTISDTEEMLDDSELQDPKDVAVDEDAIGANRKLLHEIKHFENEVPKWQVLVDQVTGVSLPDFDSKTLAVLRGRIVRYLIQSREVTFGRSAKENTIDIDLSLEGPAWKISRRQGVIKMDNNGEFCIINEAKKPIYIDGKPVLNGTKYKLSNNSVIEIAVLRFIFIVNQEAIAALKSKISA